MIPKIWGEKSPLIFFYNTLALQCDKVRPGAEKNLKNFKKTIDKKTNIWYCKTVREKENSKLIEACGCAPTRGQIKGRKRIKPTGLNRKPAG